MRFIDNDDFNGFINQINSKEFSLVEFVRVMNTLCLRMGEVDTHNIQNTHFLKYFVTLLRNNFKPSEIHLSLIVASAAGNDNSGLYLFNILLERYPEVVNSDIIMANVLRAASFNKKFAVQIINKVLYNTPYGERFVAGECLVWAAKNKLFGAMIVKGMLERSISPVYPAHLAAALNEGVHNHNTGFLVVDFIIEYCISKQIKIPLVLFRQAFVQVFHLDRGLTSFVMSMLKYMKANPSVEFTSATSDLLLNLASNHEEGPELVSILLDFKLSFSDDAIDSAILKLSNPFVNDRLEKSKGKRSGHVGGFRDVRRKMDDGDIDSLLDNMEF